MGKIVILNGPPGSGKDVIAESMQQHGFNRRSFKTALYTMVASYYNVPLNHVISLATDRDTKELPFALFDGRSPREALIHVSEDIVKPTLGPAVFGWLLGMSVDNDRYVVSDGGFDEEIVPLIQMGHSVLIIHLSRDGCTFDNDSRNYVNAFPAITYKYHNNSTIENAAKAIALLANNKPPRTGGY